MARLTHPRTLSHSAADMLNDTAIYPPPDNVGMVFMLPLAYDLGTSTRAVVMEVTDAPRTAPWEVRQLIRPADEDTGGVLYSLVEHLTNSSIRQLARATQYSVMEGQLYIHRARFTDDDIERLLNF